MAVTAQYLDEAVASAIALLKDRGFVAGRDFNTWEAVDFAAEIALAEGYGIQRRGSRR